MSVDPSRMTQTLASVHPLQPQMVAPAAPVAAPMEEPSVPANLFQQAVAQYPILGRQNIAYQARPKGVQPTGMLEFYSPEETDRPAGMPLGQQGVAVFDSKTTPLDILADWTSHYGRVKDPVVKKNYDTFVKTFTPEQNKMLKEQYKYARENEGETRTFDQWKEVSGIPAWYRGYLFNQWPKSFIDKFYTAAQLQHLNKVRPYLNLRGNEK